MSKRSQNPAAPGTATARVDPLDTLLDHLTEHGLNMWLGQPYWQELAARGPELIPYILDRCDGERPFKLIDRALQEVLAATDGDQRERAAELLGRSLGRDIRRAPRIEAIKAFAPIFSHDARHVERLLDIALDPDDEPEARAAAFNTLAKMHLSIDHAAHLLDALGQAFREEHTPLSDAVFTCLCSHAQRIPGRRLRQALEVYLTHESPRLRRRAIELIGKFGDLDMVEHLFALPHAHLHLEDIRQATTDIGGRPINLVSLRPDAFEAVVSRILKAMGYQDVEPTRYSGDRGVDATCYRLVQGFPAMERERVVIQYKRYAKKLIGEDTLHAFAETYRPHEANYGLFITTSDYTKGAVDYAGRHGRLRLIAGPALVEGLNKACNAARYVIRGPV